MTSPYGPYQTAPAAVRPHRRGSVVGPLVLIFIGAVFLLQNTGVLPGSVWGNLWRLWPLLLVLGGLELLFGHRLQWVALAGVTIIVLALGVMLSGMATSGASTSGPPVVYDTQIGDASQSAVIVRFGAGELNLAALTDPRPDQLASMTYVGPADVNTEARYSVQNMAPPRFATGWSSSGDVTVTPGPALLTLTTFAPTVIVSTAPASTST